ncbi:MAG: bifunctional DNA-formamidopyrimidine glycosylase/DNA-(apurinic or apyrimidinic site) lyase [Candidatus Omnitrophica bacterium]|nr:bifunctional DNA-formamidopyrimidine glycosylase/DNA-(apurinic or apyrimidinic site) lyase [Candidatus Omnitrophota bacterium]
MPELPEVETIVRWLQREIQGFVLSKIEIRSEAILNSPKQEIESKTAGTRIQRVFRKGKYLGMDLSAFNTLWVHLGMTGQLVWLHPSKALDSHVHALIEFEGKSERLVYRDIRKFGSIFLTKGRSSGIPRGLSQLGPEPLELESREFVRIFKERTGRIKSLLLNQQLLAGLGNIYADESLHRAGIDPRRRSFRIPQSRLEALLGSVREVLEEAIASGGSTIDDYLHPDGTQGTFQKRHRVYGRENQPCPVCQTKIRRLVIAGRSSHFCPSCQK